MSDDEEDCEERGHRDGDQRQQDECYDGTDTDRSDSAHCFLTAAAAAAGPVSTSAARPTTAAATTAVTSAAAAAATTVLRRCVKVRT